MKAAVSSSQVEYDPALIQSLQNLFHSEVMIAEVVKLAGPAIIPGKDDAVVNSRSSEWLYQLKRRILIR